MNPDVTPVCKIDFDAYVSALKKWDSDDELSIFSHYFRVGYEHHRNNVRVGIFDGFDRSGRFHCIYTIYLKRRSKS